ncbi:LTA synthase family protein [Ruminococcaceae bacterium OttesenSCG-928-N02]|nr:LTA synthase family protein [Ruminococcaceae bacterium OttesenSCG-928-N02]
MSLIAALVLPFLYQIFIEYVRIANFEKLMTYLAARANNMLYAWPVLVLLFIACIALFRRPAAAAGIMGTVLFVAAVVNANKLLYRGEPLLPKDLGLIREGINITGEIELVFGAQAFMFLGFVLVTTLLLWPVVLPKIPVSHARLAQFSIAAFMVFAGAFYTRTYLHNRAVMQTAGVGNAIIGKARSYNRSTFVTAFLYDVSSLIITDPDNYNQKNMLELAQQLTQDDTQQTTPDIIIIMSESYFHLEDVIPYTYSEDITANFDFLAQQGYSGYHFSQGYGGGTANIEFSALSGYMIAALPYGSTPYNEYLYEEYPAYPNFLYQNGYQTAAIHSYDRFFYNRESAYQDLMFENAYFMDDFTRTYYMGPYISEQCTMEEVVARYEEMRAQSDAPVFIHTVTMQNHVEYQAGTYPSTYRVTVENPQGLSAQDQATLETVATNLRDIDRSLGYLANYLAMQDRDVVLLFFGDHQTGIKVNGVNIITACENISSMSEMEELLATHRVPYLMWSNFEEELPARQSEQTAGQAPESETVAPTITPTTAGDGTTEIEQGTVPLEDVPVQQLAPPLISASMLLPIFTQRYNLPQPAFFGWLYEQLNILPGHILGYAITPQGNITPTMSEEQQQVYDAWALMQYDCMFGKGYIKGLLFQGCYPGETDA